MHPDSSTGVQAQVRVSAGLPSLTWVAYGIVVRGAAFLAGGVTLLVGLALPDRPRPDQDLRLSAEEPGLVPSPRTAPDAVSRSRAAGIVRERLSAGPPPP